MRKKLITMGLVSALGASTSVMAADLDATAPGNAPENFATDTALVGNQNTDGTIDLNFNSGGVVNTTAIGVGVAGDNQTFIRFDLTAAEFEGAVTTGMISLTGNVGSSTSVAQGGADGGSFVIFDVTSNNAAPITQTSAINFTPGVAASLASAASVSISVHETLTGAVNQADSLYAISGPFATFGQNLDVDTDPDTATAEVSTGFLAFTGAVDADTAAIGNWGVTVDTTDTNMNSGLLVAAVGEMVTLASTNLTLNGDVSFGDWFIDETADNCAAADVDLVEDTDTFDNATANATGLAAGSYYSLCVDVDGTEVINAGDYSLTFEWDTGTRPVPAADETIAIGSIARNGTTIQIPYLTTFEDYNQRLVIVNRGASAAEYSITFTSEDGVTATAGTAATGTVPAGEVVSLRATDIVTLTGKTRTAATLLVVAPSANIDAATNQVNLSDGSTDTVVLQ